MQGGERGAVRLAWGLWARLAAGQVRVHKHKGRKDEIGSVLGTGRVAYGERGVKWLR